MNPVNPLDSVYFIKLPSDFALSDHAIQVDPEILLPVQKKDASASESIDIKELTQEQILSGILTVLAYDRGNAHLDYYRKIIMEARPNIKVKPLSLRPATKTGNWQKKFGLPCTDLTLPTRQ